MTPGWKEYVKGFYDEAREAFLTWRQEGSPRLGFYANRMRSSRTRFELALKKSKQNEKEIRAEAMAKKVAQKDTIPFWRDVESLRSWNI